MIRRLALALLLTGAATSAQAQNLLIRGGPIYTGVEATPTAEVVQVRDGRIYYVGSFAEAPTYPHNVQRQAFVELDGVMQPAPAPRFSLTPAPQPRAPGA